MMPRGLNRRMNAGLGLVLLVASLGLAGCASAPAPHLLSLPLPELSSAAGASAAVRGAVSGPAQVLAVRRVNIPEYLQADKVRYRAADSVLVEWPGTAWAERLEVGLTDHLIMRLRLALPGWVVCERACPAQTATTPALSVDLAPLDYVRAASELRADVRWQLSARADSKDVQSRSVRNGALALALPVSPDSPEGQAAALGHLLDKLAQDVAGALRP
jgi:uncharacterized lipoprotein YmbA